jgi:hypothetical protein
VILSFSCLNSTDLKIVWNWLWLFVHIPFPFPLLFILPTCKYDFFFVPETVNVLCFRDKNQIASTILFLI